VKGVQASEQAFGTFIKSADQFDTNLASLGKTSKASLGRMAEAMKGIGDTGIAGTFKDAQKQLLQEQINGEGLSLNLVRAQTTALKNAYEHRLAKIGQMSAKELKIWKDLEVGIGGFQAAQLKEFQRAEGLKRQAEREALSARRKSMTESERDMLLNVKYATDTNTALQQVSDQGSSRMLANIQKRSESIRRMLEGGSADAEKLATKKYGSDFVGTVRQGIQGSGQVLAGSDETRIALIGAMATKEAEAIKLAAKKVEQARIEATANARTASATRMNLDETRMLLGVPDRNEMKTLAAQIKSQMQEGLSKEKLRASSATKMNLDETRMLLGVPDRNEMKTLAAQIKSQMQEALANEQARRANTGTTGQRQARLSLHRTTSSNCLTGSDGPMTVPTTCIQVFAVWPPASTPCG
jgi:hypothetical protein